MSTETRPTVLEPITPENAVVLFVDQQEGWYTQIYEPQQTQHHVLALARSAQLLGVPAVLTTNLSAGRNGPQLNALTETFSGQEVIDRSIINAWLDPCVREAITRTGRKQVIISGTGFELCATLPALSAVAEGYATYVVVDASGRFDPLPVTEMTRLAQAGVVLVNTNPLVLEMMEDNTHLRANEIYTVLFSNQ